jgi:hypothetical protein
MVRAGAVLTALLLLTAVAMANVPATLPPLVFEDQDGRTVRLDALRGQVVVIVYGNRDAMDASTAWGRRLEADLRAQEDHAPGDPPPERRTVRLLALAQMGGIPEPLRPMLRSLLRAATPADFSLWLDWDDRMGRLFGAHHERPSVVVADGHGDVRLVIVGTAEGARWDAVADMMRRLR